MPLFKKRRRVAYTKPLRPKKIKKRTLADEFKKKRTNSIKYKLSKTKFSFSKIARKIAALSVIILIVIFAISLIFLTEFFTVQDIIIARSNFRIDPEEIDKVAYQYRNKKIFSINTDEMRRKIIETNPQIANVQIKKDYSEKRIYVELESYPIVARWKMSVKSDDILGIREENNPEEVNEERGENTENKTFISKEFFISEIGKVTIGTEADNNAFLIEEAELQRSFFDQNEQVLSKKDLDIILKAREDLMHTLGVTIERAEYYRDAREFHLIDSRERSFWIDYATPYEKQIDKLEFILEEQGEIINKEVEYFDLRVKERVFYK